MALGFNYPQYLYFLFLIPLIVFVHFAAIRTRKKYAIKFSNFEAIARIKGVDLYSKNVTILALTLVVALLLIFASSGLYIEREMLTSSSSFIIAIDASRSMEANDFPPSRIESAKETAISFVDSTPLGTKIGIISFSGVAYIEQELTDDMPLVRQSINNIGISTIGGTDLYDPIVTSANLLNNEKSKAVILLSDGQFNIGNLDEAIEYSNAHGLTIYTIGMGTEYGGNTTYGLSTLEQGSLRSLAYLTNGKSFFVSNKNELDNSLKEIVHLRINKVSLNLSKYLLIGALIVFIIEYLFISFGYRRFP